MKDPRTIATTPPAVSTPWLATLISAIRSPTPKRMRSTPAQLMGKLWKAKKARISAMPPITPGRMAPGFCSSKKMPSMPTIIRMYAMFGSVMSARRRSRKRTSMGLTVAPRVSRVTGPRAVLTVRPSALARRSGTLSATRSTTFSLTASRSVIDTDDRTARSAQSTLCPRSVASVRAKAAASFSIFLPISFPVSPPMATGCAAPMFVAGAMAATWAASVMNTPAEAARAPVGATYTMTGISEFKMVWAMERMERSSPPGVLSRTTRACACSARARSMAAVRSRAVTGVIAPSMSTMATGGAARTGAGPATAISRATAATSILLMPIPLSRGTCPGAGSERAAQTLHRLDQTLDLGGSIVDGKARPERAHDAKPLHERLRAVMPGAHRDASLVQDRRTIVGVNAVHREGHDSAFDLGIPRPVDRDAGDADEPVQTACREVALVRRHPLHAELGEVLHGRPETHGARDGWRARLEAPRQVVPLGVIDPDLLDHLAAAPCGLERLQRLAASVEHADPRRAQHLVTREHVEVGPQRRQIQRQVGSALRAVEEHERPRAVRALHDLGHRIDRAQHVRHVGGRDEPGPGRQEPTECLHVEEAFADHGHRLQHRAPVAAGHLPRNQVRVVLHLRHDDLVAGPERPPHALGDQVDRLRRAAGEDDLLARARPHECPHGVARTLV